MVFLGNERQEYHEASEHSLWQAALSLCNRWVHERAMQCEVKRQTNRPARQGSVPPGIKVVVRCPLARWLGVVFAGKWEVVP